MKRIKTEYEKSKELTKKKSLKTRPYSLKPNDIATSPSYSQTPINVVFRHQLEPFGSPPHTINTNRPHIKK
jgi:hypothetical protein